MSIGSSVPSSATSFLVSSLRDRLRARAASTGAGSTDPSSLSASS